MTKVKVTSVAVKTTNRNLMKVIDRLTEESNHIRNMEPPTRDGRGRAVYNDLVYLSDKLDKCTTRLYQCKKDLDALYVKIKDYEEA